MKTKWIWVIGAVLLSCQLAEGQITLDSGFAVNGIYRKSQPGFVYSCGFWIREANGIIEFNQNIVEFLSDGNYTLKSVALKYLKRSGQDALHPLNGKDTIPIPEGLRYTKWLPASGSSLIGVGPNRYISRLTNRFEIDSSFGINGVSSYSIPANYVWKAYKGAAYDSASQSLYHYSMVGSRQTGLEEGMLVKLDRFGQVDRTFADSGYAHFPGCYVKPADVSLVSGNKVLISAGENESFVNMTSVWSFWRLGADGRADSSFGENGKAQWHTGLFWSNPYRIVPLRDGRFYVAGNDNYDNIIIARFLANGSIDTSFNQGQGHRSYPGWECITPGCFFDFMADSSGGLLAAAPWVIPATTSQGRSQHSWGILRIDSIGQPDSAFGTNGIWHYDPDPNGAYSRDMRALTVQPDGKILMSGGVPSNKGYMLLRLKKPRWLGPVRDTIQKEDTISFPPPPDTAIVTGWKVYPNPATGQLTVQYGGSRQTGAQVILYDIIGRRIMAQYMPEGTSRISLSVAGFAAGMYQLMLFPKEGKPQTYKILLNGAP